MDVGLSRRTYRVWRQVLERQGVDWESLATSSDEQGSIWAWGSEEVAARFHPSIVRRLAERALEVGEPVGEGADWVAAGGDGSAWLELEDLLRALRAHGEIEECTLLVGRGDEISGR